jgi:predicted esterase
MKRLARLSFLVFAAAIQACSSDGAKGSTGMGGDPTDAGLSSVTSGSGGTGGQGPADAQAPMDAQSDAPTGDGGKMPRPGACMPLIVPTQDVQTERQKGTTCAALGYHEYVPPTYDASSNWPLILAFHGDGERGNGTSELGLLLNSGLPQMVKNGTWDPQKRFVVLSPQMDDRDGKTERTGQSVKDFIAFAVANYDVDVHRIYLTGYSGGAEPIYNYLGAEAGGVVAATLPISGWYSTQNTECTWTQIPIWYFHGAKDGTVPAPQHSTPSYNNLVACNPGATIAPRYTMYANRGHDDWNLTYDLSGMNATDYPVVGAPPGTTPYDVSIYDWFLKYSH